MDQLIERKRQDASYLALTRSLFTAHITLLISCSNWYTVNVNARLAIHVI